MRVGTETAGEPILDRTPRLFGAAPILASVANAIVAGGGTLAAFIRQIRLRPTRAGAEVQMLTRAVLGLRRRQAPLADIRPAVLETADFSARAIDPVFPSGRGPGRTAGILNRWLGVEG